MFKTMIVSFGEGSTPAFELRFTILSGPTAQTWARFMAMSLSNKGVRERRRFSNFQADAQVELRENLQKLQDCVVELRSLSPHIEFGELDFRDPQKEINRLHIQFADRHLTDRDISRETAPVWAEFNLLLHRAESVLYREQLEARTKIKNAVINVTMYNDITEKLRAQQFANEGVLFRTFGVCYAAYPQVGRHIREIFFTKDLDIPSEHVRPFDTLSADFFIWMGHSQGHAMAIDVERQMEKWYREDGKEILKNAGLEWDLYRLGVPDIPVASLEQPLFSTHDIWALQEKIANHPYVAAIYLE